MNFKSVAPFVFLMAKKYPVQLTDDEKTCLLKLTRTGECKARIFKRAMILLACNDGKTYKEITESLGVSRATVCNTRRRYFLEGLEPALHERQRPGQPKKVTPEVEAKITTLACEAPPEGRNHWTISLLKEESKKRFSIKVGWGSVQRTLANHELKPWKKKAGVSRKSMTSL